MNGRVWTRSERKLLREFYEWIPTPEIAAELGRALTTVYKQAAKLGLRKSPEAFSEACKWRPGRRPGAEKGWFPKGHVPANKGVKSPGVAPGRMRETQFRKGQLNGAAALLFKPIGSLRICDGYLYRKVSAKPGPWTVNWVLEHRRIWQKAYPRKRIDWRTHALVFKDGDRGNVKLSNLELITRKELRHRNSIHNLPAEIKEVIRLKATIRRVATKRERKMQHAEE